MSDPQSEQAEANRTGGRAREVAKAQTEGEEIPMTFCCLCQIICGIERRAAPVAEGVPLCIEHRNRPTPASEPAVELDQSAAMMLRYGERLSRQAGGLAPAPASTTVHRP
jgi:hypothetical protein